MDISELNPSVHTEATAGALQSIFSKSVPYNIVVLVGASKTDAVYVDDVCRQHVSFDIFNQLL